MAPYPLTYILPFIAIFLFLIVYSFNPNLKSYLLFVLYLLPLMSLRITSEELGGFTVFDFISFFCLLFHFKKFTLITKTDKSNYGALFFVLLSISLIGSIVSEFPAYSALSLIKSLPIFIYARFLDKEFSVNKPFNLSVIKTLKYVYIFNLLFTAIQITVGLEFTFYPQLGYNTFNKLTNLIRYPGFFADAQFQGQYLAMGSFLFLYFHQRLNTKKILYNILLFVAAICALVLAGSRAAFGGFCIGLITLLFFAYKEYWKYALLIFIGIIIYVVHSPNDGVFSRTQEISSDYEFRENMWSKAYDISLENPFFGIGVGNYKRYTEYHFPEQYIEMDGEFIYYDHPENGYLKILVEYGFIIFFVLIFLIIKQILKAYHHFKKGYRDMRLILISASIISWLFAFNTVYTLSDHRILIMVISFILIISNISYERNKLFSKPNN